VPQYGPEIEPRVTLVSRSGLGVLVHVVASLNRIGANRGDE